MSLHNYLTMQLGKVNGILPDDKEDLASSVRFQVLAQKPIEDSDLILVIKNYFLSRGIGVVDMQVMMYKLVRDKEVAGFMTITNTPSNYIMVSIMSLKEIGNHKTPALN